MNAIAETRVRPYTGAEYCESLRDGREIWIQGDRVRDVTTHVAFRVQARMVARLYDALHDPGQQPVLTTPTDTGRGGYTHRFFKASRSATDFRDARDAIAHWAGHSYGWMRDSPDYAAAFVATLGANPAAFAPYDQNARRWYRTFNDYASFAHYLPVTNLQMSANGTAPAVHVAEETTNGLILSGTALGRTMAALTHHIVLTCGAVTSRAGNPTPPLVRRRAFACVVSTAAPGVRLLCRSVSAIKAAAVGTPFDYPLSSRMDDTGCVLVFDRVLVPWEDVFAYDHADHVTDIIAGSGATPRLMLQECTRLAVKMDFLAGLLLKATEATGGNVFQGVEAQVGEVVAWRHLFWSLSDAMTQRTIPWADGYVLPNPEYGLTYRVMASLACPKIKEIVEDTLASALIYLPSSALDFKAPELRPYLDRFVRGSNGYTAEQRVKLMKLMWDAVGAEGGVGHELYERGHLGDPDSVRCALIHLANSTGASNRYKACVERSMAEYDLNGWVAPDMRSEQ